MTLSSPSEWKSTQIAPVSAKGRRRIAKLARCTTHTSAGVSVKQVPWGRAEGKCSGIRTVVPVGVEKSSAARHIGISTPKLVDARKIFRSVVWIAREA